MSLDGTDAAVEVVVSSECPRVVPLMLIIPARTPFLYIVLEYNGIAR